MGKGINWNDIKAEYVQSLRKGEKISQQVFYNRYIKKYKAKFGHITFETLRKKIRIWKKEIDEAGGLDNYNIIEIIPPNRSLKALDKITYDDLERLSIDRKIALAKVIQTTINKVDTSLNSINHIEHILEKFLKAIRTQIEEIEDKNRDSNGNIKKGWEANILNNTYLTEIILSSRNTVKALSEASDKKLKELIELLTIDVSNIIDIGEEKEENVSIKDLTKEISALNSILDKVNDSK